MAQDHPSDLEYHIGFWLRFASNHVSHAFRDRIAKRGVTVAEWVALRCLHQRAPCKLGELATQIGIDPGAASRLVERLIVKKLAERNRGEEDRRAVILDLTSNGRALVRRIAADADANDDAFFSFMPAADRADLLRILKSYVAHHRLTEKPTT